MQNRVATGSQPQPDLIWPTDGADPAHRISKDWWLVGALGGRVSEAQTEVRRITLRFTPRLPQQICLLDWVCYTALLWSANLTSKILDIQ